MPHSAVFVWPNWNTLAAAVIDVQRGHYEPARQLTSDFYTDLRRQVDEDHGSPFTPAQREALKSLLPNATI